MNVDKIATTLIRFRDISLKFHVALFKKRGEIREDICKIHTFDDKSYMNYEPNMYLTLEINSAYDEEWNPKKSIMITNKSLFQVVHGFRTFINSFYDQKIFYRVKGSSVIKLYADMAKKYTVKLELYGFKESVMMELVPAVVLDSEGTTYEGCHIKLHERSNYGELSITEIEALSYMLSRIDMFTYASAMLNYHAQTIDKMNVTQTHVQTSNKVRTSSNHILLERSKEEVKSSIIKKSNDDEFFGIKED
jgi:hypothetical protein